MDELSIEELLEKNSEIREIFEENVKKLESHRSGTRSGTGYGLALPYDGPRLRQNDQTNDVASTRVSYQRF